ncbi:MAG: N-6 DNA methylase [Deltaproteobacteria bacterium]
MAVHASDPWPSMSSDEKGLRNRLRARGRQLGDTRDAKKETQTIEHLVTECAYEHWHRMLFARFLAENHLLIEPDTGVAISIDDCQELARAKNVDWVDLACRFAEGMLPQIFRKGDPALELKLPPEDRMRLEKILKNLFKEIFIASDSLGWVYQFWQAEKKDQVNASGNKIGADELPAVTQLFTEDYMVDFLLDNTLGAWWAGKMLVENPKLAETAKEEIELREAVALPDTPWSFLRFIKNKDGKWTPAAGTFDGWPKVARELTCLDPCMGSGHFMVAMFQRLVAMRMAEEKMSEKAAIEAVIRDNLFGLEIDPRCTQIAAFNLALTAWKSVGHCPLPAMHLACSGLGVVAKKEDWLALAKKDDKLRAGMERLYDLFQKAPVLGSLINPRCEQKDLLVAEFHELQPLLEKALGQEAKDEATHEMAVTAQGVAKAAEILAGKFTLVATNVPYLGRGRQDSVLKDFCEMSHPDAKADLATCFVERCLGFCAFNGSAALVTPQNWLFLTTYKDLRTGLLEATQWNAVARLGSGAFETIGGEVVNVALLCFSHKKPNQEDIFLGLDAGDEETVIKKKTILQLGPVSLLSQKEQLAHPDGRLIIGLQMTGKLLSDYVTSNTGLQTGDNEHYSFLFWELPKLLDGWEFFHRTCEQTSLYGGRIRILRWEDGNGSLVLEDGCAVRGLDCRTKNGILVHRMSDLPVTVYSGDIFDQNGAVLLPLKQEDLLALWCFLSSPSYCETVRKLDKKIGVTPATLVQVPIDLDHWQVIAVEKYPHGLPKPFSSDPTQWLFNGHPNGSNQPLHVAVARLLGYRWPRQTGSSFPDCPALGKDDLEKLVDDDGIVCISAIKGEAPAADRLRTLLLSAFAEKWSVNKQNELLAQVDYEGKSLEEWLRNGFFEQHCQLFYQRPLIWQIWDGLRDGFSVLVNYHLLNRKNLEKLTYTYLGDWITQQQTGVTTGVEGSDAKLTAAKALKGKLEKILEGEPPYDIFVRWKPLKQQPIGWEPDLNVGVRLNIRPFVKADVLRRTPKVKWDKDRGKAPIRDKDDYPWFWGWDESTIDFKGAKEFDGNRWNDLHYTIEFKKNARPGKGERK